MNNHNPAVPAPQDARDCYEMAEEWNCTPEEAVSRLMREGWVFWDYDAVYGTELYRPPQEQRK